MKGGDEVSIRAGAYPADIAEPLVVMGLLLTGDDADGRRQGD